jgi:putative oxidoreductase
MSILTRFNRTTAPAAVLLIRVLVGWVFVSEGVQKFLFPDAIGAGRFTKIGIPAPAFTGPFVGAVEILCGTLILLGLLTRLATIPLLLSMTVAVISTKMPILFGHGFGPFAGPKTMPYGGVWGMLHEARTDFSMILGLVFLLVVGGGRRSLDARLFGDCHSAASARTT